MGDSLYTMGARVPRGAFGRNRDNDFGSVTRWRQGVLDAVPAGPLSPELVPAVDEEDDAAWRAGRASASPPPSSVKSVKLGKRTTAADLHRMATRGDYSLSDKAVQRVLSGLKKSAQADEQEEGRQAPIARSKSTPVMGTGTPSPQPRRRRRRTKTPEQEALTLRQFEDACEALHLPGGLPGVRGAVPADDTAAWFGTLTQNKKRAIRGVLERTGGAAAIIVAGLPAEDDEAAAATAKLERLRTELAQLKPRALERRAIRLGVAEEQVFKAADADAIIALAMATAKAKATAALVSRRAKRVEQTRSKDFEAVLNRNRKVRMQAGRNGEVCSLAKRLTDEKEDGPSRPPPPPRDRARGIENENLEALGLLSGSADGEAFKADLQVWVGNIPDELARTGAAAIEHELRRLFVTMGEIKDVAVETSFGEDINQSHAVMTFQAGRHKKLVEILAANLQIDSTLLEIRIHSNTASLAAEVPIAGGWADSASASSHERDLASGDSVREQRAMTPLPRLGPADRTVNAAPELAQEAVDPGEAVRQWVARIRHVMDAGNHTLGLNGRYLGQGGTAALLVAVNLLEEEGKEEKGDEAERYMFKRLMLASNSIAPTDEQNAAAVANNYLGGQSGSSKLKAFTEKAHAAGVDDDEDGAAHEAALVQLDWTETETVENGFLPSLIGDIPIPDIKTKGTRNVMAGPPVDFEQQAKELRAAKKIEAKAMSAAARRIQRAYRLTGSRKLGGIRGFVQDAQHHFLDGNNSAKGSNGVSAVDNVAKFIGRYVQELRKLDLSHNMLHVFGGNSIATVLEDDPVHLKHLLLRGCALGDLGAAAILKVVGEKAPNLCLIDLRKNGLGNDEFGDRGASGALRLLLEDGCCELRTLKLGYNNLRHQHIKHVAPALRDETRLIYLDLSWNSLGNKGAMLLSDALRYNQTLRFVDLTHNEIKEKGAFVVADVLKENRRLDKVVLDGNPIGERGARAVLRTMRRLIVYGWRREISIAHCNIDYHDRHEDIFEPQEAGGRHRCNLADPYDRAKAWGLVELAWDEDGENWIGETYNGAPYDLDEPPAGEIWTREKFQLPLDGELALTYFSTMRMARYSDVIERDMLQQLLMLMTHKSVTDGGVKILKLAAHEFFFTANMVGNLITLMKDSINRIEVACALLPRVVDTVNIVTQAFDVLTNGELAVMEKNMGILFHFNPVNPTGHYHLQLANRWDRIVAFRLAQISEEQGTLRKQQQLLDTSQKGDWDNFRNETLNSQPHDFEVEVLSAGGMEAGILEFDFVSTDANFRQALLPPMPDEVFEQFMREIYGVSKNVLVRDRHTGKTNRPGVSPFPPPSIRSMGLGLPLTTSPCHRLPASIMGQNAATLWCWWGCRDCDAVCFANFRGSSLLRNSALRNRARKTTPSPSPRLFQRPLVSLRVHDTTAQTKTMTTSSRC